MAGEAAERALLARPAAGRVRAPGRIAPVLTRLGEPQRTAPIIHLTGTNGKTTTARMIDALLRGAGLRVGRFTSPHLHSLRERIVIDGAPLSSLRLAEVHERIAPELTRADSELAPPLSFFEAITVLAFAAFAGEVDVIVLEAGVGGRGDATNAADGQLAVITPIALDHTELLGPDLGAIAAEKAGIIKPGAQVLLGAQSAPARAPLSARAQEVGATVVDPGDVVTLRGREPAPDGQRLTLGLDDERLELTLSLLGAHQADNAMTAIAAAATFLRRRGRRLSATTVSRALGAIDAPGRLERVAARPPLLVDVAHNPAAVAATVAALRESFPGMPFTVVLAAPADKDVAGIVRALDEVAADLVATANGSPRGLAPEALGQIAAELLGGQRVAVRESLADAIGEAVARRARVGGGVLICGSVVTVGRARTLARATLEDRPVAGSVRRDRAG